MDKDIDMMRNCIFTISKDHKTVFLCEYSDKTHREKVIKKSKEIHNVGSIFEINWKEQIIIPLENGKSSCENHLKKHING